MALANSELDVLVIIIATDVCKLNVLLLEEEETHNAEVNHVLLEQRVINVQISHVIVPLWVVGI